MGSCSLNQERDSNEKQIRKMDFVYKKVIGRGGFGKVWIVQKKKDNMVYAMKEMMKARVLAKHSTTSVMNERRLLAQLRNDFLVNMHYAFQDRENLYMILDLLQGGDMRYHIGRKKKLTEEQTQFVIACIINGLEYLHTKGIVHRDIKPENLVVDSQLYVRITDLGIARMLGTDNLRNNLCTNLVNNLPNNFIF